MIPFLVKNLSPNQIPAAQPDTVYTLPDERRD